MKLYKISFLMLGSALAFGSCADIDNQIPEGGALTADQTQQTNIANPSRVDATFSGMFTQMANPNALYKAEVFVSRRDDDFGFVMQSLSNDLEGADLSSPDNDYNWFSNCGEMSSRNANYANPYIRYVTPYREIGTCNEIIASYPEGTTEASAVNQISQARAMRAFSYMSLAPYFQFGYATAADSACVPILKTGVDYTNNPRATVKAVYEYALDDLNYAVEHLEGAAARSSKAQIDINVAYGLRARVNLFLNNWDAAAADAEKAQSGYTPASISEVSVPAFCQLSEHDWMWGIDITSDMVAGDDQHANASSWISAFSADGYAAACQVTPFINKLLYDKIPDTDVRKGWWLNANSHSPLLSTLSWGDLKGDEIATGVIKAGNDVLKDVFLPYTNVKFGMKSGIGSTTNNNDWPLMRVEEMILIQAEGLAKGTGGAARAKLVLENFVKTYRDPNYSADAGGRSLEDEIWYQRRVELWGEGFFTSDAKRLNKNVVRFHGAGTTNLSDAYQFNVAANDGWLNMRFPQREMDNNRGIIDNTGGSLPVAGQMSVLRDGVTD